MVDLKFTDLPGTWQHMGLSLKAFDEDAFSDGIGFDGSSIRGFQEIYESDMLLMPDAATAIVDPFYEQTTISGKKNPRSVDDLMPAILTLGATPTMPMPFEAAAIVPAVWVPWPFRSLPGASGVGAPLEQSALSAAE